MNSLVVIIIVQALVILALVGSFLYVARLQKIDHGKALFIGLLQGILSFVAIYFGGFFFPFIAIGLVVLQLLFLAWLLLKRGDLPKNEVLLLPLSSFVVTLSAWFIVVSLL